MSTRGMSRQSILLSLAGTLLAAVAVKYTGFGSSAADSAVSAADSVPVAEKRLEILRRKEALVAGREEVLKRLQGELQTREKGIVAAGTAEQAKAHLLVLLHNVAASNNIDARGADILPEPKPLGKDYGQVSVGQTFTCGPDQLVNFLTSIANQPEMLATESIYVAGRNVKDKTVQVRLTLAAVVSRKLVPEKKGVGF